MIQGLFFDKNDFVNEVVLGDFSSDLVVLDITTGEDIFYRTDIKKTINDPTNLIKDPVIICYLKEQ